MLPVLGLYADIYARRHGTCAAAYAMISKKKAELFPATFEYVHRSRLQTTTSSSTQVLFGDLIAAVEQTIDNEGAAAASKSLEGTFAPGTNAQRHRLLQSRGSKHGSSSSGSTRRLLTKQVSFGANKILKRTSSSLSTASPTPRVTFAEPPAGERDGRPPLLRAKTWRSGPPPM